MKLLVDEQVYQRRLDLMAEMIAMKAPAILIHKQAELIQECYEYEGLNSIPKNPTKDMQCGGGLVNGGEPTSPASEETT